jgi:hypothetical protein
MMNNIVENSSFTVDAPAEAGTGISIFKNTAIINGIRVLMLELEFIDKDIYYIDRG